MSITILNSEDRDSGTSTDGAFKFTNSNKLSGEYKILEFVMGNCLYNVNDTNNKIYFNESASLKTATLVNGNYSSFQFAAIIKTAMDLAGGNTYIVSYNAITNKVSWTSAGNFGFAFFTNQVNSSYKLLGISNLADDVESMARTSDNCIDLAPNKIIYLYFPEGGNNITLSNNNQTSLYISVGSNFGDVIRQNYSDENITLNFNDKTNISFILQNEDGNELLHSNGTEWNLILDKQ